MPVFSGQRFVPRSAQSPTRTPRAGYRGLDAQARQDGADLLPACVSVMERLRDDDAGSSLQGPIVNDDPAFRVDRPQPESDAGWSRQLTPDLVAR
jgi:hypothetical protein